MLDLSLYSLLVFVHVFAAVALMGGTLGAPLTHSFVTRARSLAELQNALEYERCARKWHPLSAFVLLGTGIYLGSAGWWAQSWFFIAIAAWTVNSAFAVLVVERTANRVARAARDADEGMIPAAIDVVRTSRAWSIANGMMIANDTVILYVMFAKPPLTETLTGLAAANLVATAVCLMRHNAAMTRRGVAQSAATT